MKQGEHGNGMGIVVYMGTNQGFSLLITLHSKVGCMHKQVLTARQGSDIYTGIQEIRLRNGLHIYVEISSWK